MSNLAQISYLEICEKLIAQHEIAIIDLREEHLFAQQHPLFASNISLSRLEVEIYNRIPRLDTLVVLYDGGEGLVERAYPKLIAYGYRNVHVLTGGLKGWEQAGGELFSDVNSASKAFGEFVEHYKQTPSLSAEALQEKINNQDNIVILDARRFDEYHTMSIPGGRSVPGAELVLRATQWVKDSDTTIIVNCAGRTRSIIGTQSLINAQVPHPIYALRNGTIGWTLAEQTLAHGQELVYSDVLDATQHALAQQNSAALAQRAGVKTINKAHLDTLRDQADKTTYVFDVRSEAEYLTGHLPESRWVAGGQLVQETDHVAATRGARIVLVDDQLVRAYMTGSWLAQMNWEVYVLVDEFDKLLTETGTWKAHTPTLAAVTQITAAQLQQRQTQENVVVLDFTTLANYKKGHIPQAKWLLKADIARVVGTGVLQTADSVVVTCGSSLLAQYAVEELSGLLTQPVYVLSGGNAAWQAQGYAVEKNQHDILSAEIDRYKRPYEGTDNSKSAMQAYLDWEFGLVEQLAKDATHGFFVV